MADEIQDSVPGKSPMKTITLQVPVKLLKDEIQDSIVLNLPVVIGSYARVVKGREIQDSIVFHRRSELSLSP